MPYDVSSPGLVTFLDGDFIIRNTSSEMRKLRLSMVKYFPHLYKDSVSTYCPLGVRPVLGVGDAVFPKTER